MSASESSTAGKCARRKSASPSQSLSPQAGVRTRLRLCLVSCPPAPPPPRRPHPAGKSAPAPRRRRVGPARTAAGGRCACAPKFAAHAQEPPARARWSSLSCMRKSLPPAPGGRACLPPCLGLHPCVVGCRSISSGHHRSSISATSSPPMSWEDKSEERRGYWQNFTSVL